MPSSKTHQKPKRLTWISRSLGHFGTELRDFLFPPGCHACDIAIATRYRPQLCYHCTLTLEDHWYSQCETCGEIERGCRCLAEPPPYTRLFSRCIDEGPAAILLRRAKDKSQQEVVRTMADLMLQDTRVEPWLRRSSALVAVPSSLPNRIKRGFDVGAELTARLANTTGVHFEENLLKRRSFRSQRLRKDLEDRRSNHQNFKARRAELEGVVGLVDDISVSTQTLRHAAAALHMAGAAEIWVWTFSRRLNTKTTEALTKE